MPHEHGEVSTLYIYGGVFAALNAVETPQVCVRATRLAATCGH